MKRFMLKSKIHRATVTKADLNYEGSITIDKKLLDEANMLEYEKVDVYNINNGERFSTYIITGERDSGIICLNGAAARKAQVGDKIIITTYCEADEAEIVDFKPKIVFVDDLNRISGVKETLV